MYIYKIIYILGSNLIKKNNHQEVLYGNIRNLFDYS